MGESPDGKLALSRQPLGEQTKHHTFAGARIAADKGEAAFAHQAVLDAPAEAVNLAGLQQRLGGQFGRERVEFKAVEAEHLPLAQREVDPAHKAFDLKALDAQQLGSEREGKVAILEGLKEGQRLVTEGCLLLQSLMDGAPKS